VGALLVERGSLRAAGRGRMDGFARVIEQWHDFYLMAGTAGATLIGLLFVSVSLHLDLITDPTATAVLASARRAFISFIIIVLIALLFLVPAQSARGLGLPLVLVSLFDLARTMRYLNLLRREHAHLSDLLGPASVLRIGLGLASSLGLLAVSLTILSGTTEYLSWLVGVLGILLGGAAENCWSLLMNLAVAKRRLANRRSAADDAAVVGEPAGPET
jgi:hypothetical protein